MTISRLDAQLADQRAEAHAQRLHAHQVDLLPEQPARVVFAEAGRLDHRLQLIGIGVGREAGSGFGNIMKSLDEWASQIFTAEPDSASAAPGKAA